jgi:glutaredoxin/glutathione-dependent peroxiredoxin
VRRTRPTRSAAAGRSAQVAQSAPNQHTVDTTVRAAPFVFSRLHDSSAKEQNTMSIKVGDKMPKGQLMRMGAKGPEPLSTDELFSGKKVVLFGVPGAFTPTCSAKHLPGFVQSAESFRKKGVDTIACMAVNDAFVMGAWGESSKASDKVMMLADGNGEYTRALGLEMDATKFGMGSRSKRFSIIVDNGVVTKLNVESPGEFGVSSAETALKQLA